MFEEASVVRICARKARQACVAPSLVWSNVRVVGVFRSICCHDGTVLWTVGFKDIKDGIRKDSVVIIQVVICYGFCVDVENFNCVKVGSIFCGGVVLA